MKDQVIDIETLQQDDHNFNKGTEAGRKLMEKSFTELGAGRSILVDKDGRIIAGNKSQKAAIAAGIRKVRVIETDGTELIAVKRTDVDLDSKKGRELALADNLTTQVNLEWDKVELEAVGQDIPDLKVEDWGLDANDLPQAPAPIPSDETEDEAIERKKREFEEKMAAGELDEDDPEYQAFLEKFEAKKTTDDCYTPEVVYEAVANWVANEYGVSRANFVRPFYPGGDYQKEKYKPTDIVVDNPPFSIMAEILNFYTDKGIKFFLFGPHLTLFSSSSCCSAIVVGVPITYANGATVNTSFLTNINGIEPRFKSSPSLYKAVKEANEKNLQETKREIPKYSYDKHIITTPFLQACSRYGIEFECPRAESERISQCDAQKECGKQIFGKGYIVSDRVFAEREKAEREKAEREKATTWELSDRERAIIARLNEAGEAERES